MSHVLTGGGFGPAQFASWLEERHALEAHQRTPITNGETNRAAGANHH